MDLDLTAGAHPVASPIAGSVWRSLVKAGERVQANDPLIILESMKMEMTVEAPTSGVIDRLLCREGEAVSAGQNVLTLMES